MVVTWSPTDETLCPGAITVELVADTAGGDRSLTNKRQFVQADAGFWRFVLHRIRIRSNSQVLAHRTRELQFNGRSGTVLIPIYDRKRAPIPPGGAPIVATADDPIPANAVSANIKVTTGAALDPGMHFSTAAGRAYRLRTVGTPAGSPAVYPVTFRPPAREAIADNAPLEFDRPVCRARLENDTAMNVMLDLMRDATPTVPFVEDV